MPITYRPATSEDIDGVARVFLSCWRGSYAAVLPRRLVDMMTDEEATALWTRVLDEAGPGEVVVAVAEPETESEAAGGARPVILGVTRFAVAGDGTGMVNSLYVSPLAQGQGVGSRLLTTAADALAAAGATTAHLWVFESNAPSIAFYRRQGWLPDGGARVQEAFGEPEIRLVRALAPSAAPAEAGHS